MWFRKCSNSTGTNWPMIFYDLHTLLEKINCKTQKNKTNEIRKIVYCTYKRLLAVYIAPCNV